VFIAVVVVTCVVVAVVAGVTCVVTCVWFATVATGALLEGVVEVTGAGV
jgi:hypothetical protein